MAAEARQAGEDIGPSAGETDAAREADQLRRLAEGFLASGNPRAALGYLARARTLFPADVALAIRHGMALADCGVLDEAEAAFHAALARAPDNADALVRLANVLVDLGRHDEAIAVASALLRRTPSHVGARASLARAHFFKEDWQRAWQLFEVRFRLMDKPPQVTRPGPDGKPQPWAPWRGGALPPSLLVIAEQGLGDTIQFVRFLPRLVAAGTAVTFVCEPALAALLGTLDCPMTLKSLREPGRVEGIKGWTPLLNLPMALGLQPSVYTMERPYLAAEPERVARWRERLGPGFKIGISWQGNPTGEIDRGRSARLADFEPLARLAGVRLVSLQKGHGADQLDDVPFASRIVVPGPDFDEGPNAFVDTAAVMECLDLVVTVDTAVGHLAGALGRPVTLLLKAFGADWRWLQNRTDTLWYPSMRLARQQRQGDWRGLIEQVAGELMREKGMASTGGAMPKVPISVGELIDKLAILEIKGERIEDADKRDNVERERAELQAVLDGLGLETDALEIFRAGLRGVNEQLWEIEDEIRLCEKAGDFGPRFIELARAVYKTNDRRADLKREINKLSGSALFEEKSYA
ncbi:MAG: DUF6165 family protein [Hyphomicrobiales bacterium]